MAKVTKYSDVFYGSQNVRSRWKWVYEIIETPDTYKVDLVATLESYVYGSNIGKTDTVNAYLKATDKAQEAWEKNGVARNYSINKGNTWGGTDIFSTTIEWAKTHSAQSKAIRTNATGSYIAATIYTPEFTIPIKTTYLINYDANGGTGAPSQQTKWHGENITLQSGIPIRAGYTFLGWATSQSGAVVYQPNATYTANSPITLYAVWEAYYTYTINTMRVNASGDIIEDSDGEWIYIKANLTTEDYTNNPLTAYHFKDNGATATVDWYKNSDKTDSVTFPYQPASNSFILYAWYHADTEKHEVSFQFDTNHTTGKVISVIVPPIFRTMDFLAGGKGVAIGKRATQEGFDVEMNTVFRNEIKCSEINGNIKNIYDVFYPVGSYYETNLPSAIPSGQSTPTDADLENLGATWFDPNYAWGGTWTSEQIKDDAIVDEGETGIWTYRKWKSGVAECWGTYSGNITSRTANAPYNSSVFDVGAVGYPSNFFADIPVVSVNTRIGSFYNLTSYANSYQNNVSISITSNASGTQTVYAYIYAKGKWKNYNAPSTLYRWHRTA